MRDLTLPVPAVPVPDTIVGLDLQNASLPSGGTGGLGRSLNDNGDLLLKLVLSGNQSGIFILGTPPPPSIEVLDAAHLQGGETGGPTPEPRSVPEPTKQAAVSERNDARKSEGVQVAPRH